MADDRISRILTRLRLRLLVFLVAIVGPLAAFQIYEIRQERSERLSGLLHRALELAERGAHEYSDAIVDVRSVLDLVSRLPETAPNASPDACAALLREIDDARQWTDGMWIVGSDRRITCATVPGGVGADVSERPWFQQTLAARTFTVSDFFTGRLRGQPASMAALPVVDVDGETRVMAATLDLSWFERLAESIGRSAGAEILLIDSKGSLLASFPERPELVGRNLAQESSVARVLAERSGAFEGTTIVGRPGLLGFVQLDNASAKLVVALDRETALASVEMATRAAALTYGAVVFLVGVAIWFAGRSVFVTPMESLSGALQATLDTMDQGLLMYDAADRVRVFNRRAVELLGLPPTLLAGNPTLTEVRRHQVETDEFSRSDDGFRSWIAHGAEGQEAAVYERERPNGIVLEVRTTPLPSGGGVRTFTDVTARRRAEDELRNREALYRLLAENSHDMITRTGPDGVWRFVSAAARDLLGYRPDELVGRRPLELVHPDDRERCSALFQRLVSGESVRATDTHRVRRKDGRWIWVEVNFKLVRDPDGQPRELVCSVRDVTERQLQAEELRSAKELAELAQAQAENASRAKTDFLAAMSHEIRTPLNSIMGFSDLLMRSQGLNGEQARYVQHLQSASGALLTVIDDILDFAKVEAGALELENAPFSLAELVDASIAMIRGLAAKKNLDVRVTVDPRLPATLSGDEARLRQILLNLLNNAVKFTQAGHVALEVVHEGSDSGGEKLRFSVSDTGIGIAPDQHQRLFQRFSQVDGSIARRFGGTGLGLAICRRLVELMGGEIGVRSAAGEGSTFWFTVTLPKVAAAVDKAKPLALPEVAPLHRRARILLAEDVPLNQEIVTAILDAAGHKVDVVTDGSEAVMAVQDQDYDLVLMDVQMPVVDGVTATRRIRALPGPERNLPIVAMTANVLPEQVEAFRSAGMNDHLGKPFRREELLQTVDRWLPDFALVDIEPRPVSSPARDELARTLGSERLDGLLRQFAALLTGAFDRHYRRAEDRVALAGEAHKIASAAGMLGFESLSDACKALEQACTGPGDVDAALFEALRARDATLREIEALISRSAAA